jgi:hypothetical protein
MATDLPSDILFEIFSRTCLKTIGRCRLEREEKKKNQFSETAQALNNIMD